MKVIRSDETGDKPSQSKTEPFGFLGKDATWIEWLIDWLID